MSEFPGYEVVRVEFLRAGILTVDGKEYEIIINEDGTFRDVVSRDRRCLADPAGVLTQWDWEELPKREWRSVRCKPESAPQPDGDSRELNQ